MTIVASSAADVRPELSEIFADVFEHVGVLTPDTSPNDVERWDSLQHLALVRALEETYELRLSMDEMVEIYSVRGIESVLRRHGV